MEQETDPTDPAAALDGPQRDPRSFVLRSELSEVYLLLDNISSAADKKLPITVPSPDTGLDQNWLRDLCRIDWPPDAGAPDIAADAALLIRVKDHLNTLAQPASGLTIAFTHLVTQEADRGRTKAAGLPHPGGSPRDPAGDDGETGATEALAKVSSRGSLARLAYPELMEKATRFHSGMNGLRGWLVMCLLLTVLLSVYLALGNAALSQRRDAQAAHDEALRKVADLTVASGVPDPQGAATAATVARNGARAATPTPQARRVPVAAARAGLDRASGTIGDADDPWLAILPRFCRPDEAGEPTGDADYPERRACAAVRTTARTLDDADEQVAQWIGRDPAGPATSARATALATILAGTVLPVVYGLLGAGAAVLLGLSRKMRHALLAPRDINVSYQQLALGAVTGACIGIFVAQPAAQASAATIIGPVAFSASGISFLAGFGSDAVFATLDAIIKRVFNPQPTPTLR